MLKYCVPAALALSLAACAGNHGLPTTMEMREFEAKKDRCLEYYMMHPDDRWDDLPGSAEFKRDCNRMSWKGA